MLGINSCLKNSFSLHYNKFVVNRILFIRHGETICNNNLMNNGLGKFDINSPLTIKGCKQGTDIDIFLRTHEYSPNFLLTSPLDRTINTAKRFNTKTEIEIVHDIVEINTKEDTIIFNDDKKKWLYQKENVNEFRERIKKWFDVQKLVGTIENRKDTLVYTHSGVIATILGMHPIYSDKDQYSLNHRYHVSNGSITCIDILETSKGRLTHVLGVNYTKHLTEPTGHHCKLI